MYRADVRLVIGTRPEAIKLAPVAHALLERGIMPSLVLTGQHRELDPTEFGLGNFAVERLHCTGQEDPHLHVKTVTEAMLSKLAGNPDLLVVQGDTSSAMGGALAGAAAGLAVAHVEAGLRTHDPLLPWPEEEYRVAIDASADLLFAPTELSAANLRAEGVPGAVFVTGNTAVDAALAAAAGLPLPRNRRSARPTLLVTCHRRESWGAGLQSIADALVVLAGEIDIQFVLHPNTYVADEMRRHLGAADRISLLEACDHRTLLGLMREADLMLSDSGGLQEEAPVFGVPLLVLRDKTERPEGVAAGCARLVGTSTERIISEVRALLADAHALEAMRQPSFPYGDGRASCRIAAVIEDWLRSRLTEVA